MAMISQAARTSIGGYRITETLGTGGMGVVYVAEHELLRRKAAMKVLLPEYTHDQEVVERFFKEAKAATAIKHPGIVKVYDFGYQDDGSAYIAMEFLDGEPLDVRLRRVGQLPMVDALRFAGQMASALGAAHSHGIVHRDLKPANVFIVADPQVAGGERIKLLDFGIAKFAATDNPDAKQTRAGALLGSPQYMAPEQIRGARDVDHRADLYSVGCMLFEMLCGRPPFDGNGNGAMAVMASHLDDPPPVPSLLRPELSREIDALVLYLLAKDPEHRYQNAMDLGSTLAAILGEPVSFDTAAGTTVELSQAGRSLPSGVALSPGGVPLSDSQVLSQITSQTGMQSAVMTQAGTNQSQVRTQAVQTTRSRRRLMIMGALAVVVAGGALVVLSVVGKKSTIATRPVAAETQPAPDKAPAPDKEPAPAKDEEPQHTYRKIIMPADSETGEPGEVVIVMVAADGDGQAPDWSRSSLSFERLISGTIFKDIIKTIRIKASPPPTVTWRITSTPSRAEIWEKGKRIGSTPLTIQLNKNAALQTTYTLRAPGHDDATVKVSGAADFQDTVALAPKIAITIESRPKGAEILDGQGASLGVTPHEVLLSRSSTPVALTLRLEGYEDLPAEIVPDQKKKEKLELIKKRATITHRIESEPSGAMVRKDKVELGVTPLETQFLEEPGKKIKYTVELDGYAEKTVRLHGEKSETELVKLDKCEGKKPPSSPSMLGKPRIVRIYEDPC